MSPPKRHSKKAEKHERHPSSSTPKYYLGLFLVLVITGTILFWPCSGSGQPIITTWTGDVKSVTLNFQSGSVEPITFTIKPFAGYSNAKVAVVNGQRYILFTRGISNLPPSNIEVYLADSDWNPTNKVSTSSFTCGDIYVNYFPSVLPTKIVFGTVALNGASSGGAAIGAFDVETKQWIIQPVMETEYIARVIYSSYDRKFYIEPLGSYVGGNNYERSNFMWRSTLENLFAGTSKWEKINAPTPTISTEIELRITYFKGCIYVQRHAGFRFDVLRYIISENRWETIKVHSEGTDKTNVAQYIRSNDYFVAYPEIWQNSLTADIWMSRDGTTWTKVSTVPVIRVTGSETHVFPVPWGYDKVIVSSTEDGVSDGGIWVYRTDGTLLASTTGVRSHDTDARASQDGTKAVMGGEICSSASYTPEIKIINGMPGGTPPPPDKGTLRVFASYQGSYIATLVTIIGPESKSGTTTTDSSNPLTFELTAGAYTVSGTYVGTPQTTSVTVVAGQTTDALLNFGGSPPPPPKSLWDQIVEFINQMLKQAQVDSRLLFLGAVAVFGVALWYGNKRLSKRAKKH